MTKDYEEGYAKGFKDAEEIYSKIVTRLSAELLELDARIAILEKTV